ncbi:hypothetical protein CUAC110523_06360 [Cutibacterium acnes subsp. defendens]|jgi:hypothetical protein|nr:hypothetical protein HMPREF1278_01544 [Propionibacterium sp. KPL1849]
MPRYVVSIRRWAYRYSFRAKFVVCGCGLFGMMAIFWYLMERHFLAYIKSLFSPSITLLLCMWLKIRRAGLDDKTTYIG